MIGATLLVTAAASAAVQGAGIRLQLDQSMRTHVVEISDKGVTVLGRSVTLSSSRLAHRSQARAVDDDGRGFAPSIVRKSWRTFSLDLAALCSIADDNAVQLIRRSRAVTFTQWRSRVAYSTRLACHSVPMLR